MNAMIETRAAGKQYGRRWALRDCTLTIPAGKVVGLVGPNGAGKTTLLQLAAGLLKPTSGTVSVLGGAPGSTPAQLAKVGFVAQDAPAYARLTIAGHLRMGEWLNPGWDGELAARRVADLSLDPRQRAGSLSGGQRAQLALTLAVAKRPELVLLDEPVASLDPLARREFLQSLMEVVAERGTSVVLSSHLIADLERVCDHLILLAEARVQLCGDIEDLLAEHVVLVGPRKDTTAIERAHTVVHATRTPRQSTLVIRRGGPIIDPAYQAEDISLEELVLAYMGAAAPAAYAPLSTAGKEEQ